MTPQALLAEATRRGIELYREAGAIRYRGPKTALVDLKPKLAACRGELLTLLPVGREEAEIDRLARDGCRPLSESGHPAYSILEICQRYGVALRIDPATGDLVVGKAGAKADEPSQPWPKLLTEIEAHLEAVARLVESGWTLTAQLPNEAAA